MITSAEDDKNEISPEIRKLMGAVKLSKGFDYKESLGKALRKTIKELPAHYNTSGSRRPFHLV